MLKKMIMLVAALILGISTAAFAGSFNSAEESTVSSEKEVQKSSIEEQLEMLEMGVVPTNPDLTVETWANAVKLRNGALQFALLSKDARAGVKKKFEKYHWVTGVSSPWVETFKVISKKENNDKTLQFEVEFSLATSTGYAGKDYASLTLVKIGDQWFINTIKSASDHSIGIWKTPEDVKEENIDKN